LRSAVGDSGIPQRKKKKPTSHCRTRLQHGGADWTHVSCI
jgi:hypothetical protein